MKGQQTCLANERREFEHCSLEQISYVVVVSHFSINEFLTKNFNQHPRISVESVARREDGSRVSLSSTNCLTHEQNFFALITTSN